MMDFQAVHYWLRHLHIVAGVVGLILFWVPMLSRKGSRLHITAGRLFLIVVYVIALTAAISSIWAIAHPVSFSGITRELSETEISVLSGNIRFLFVILFMLMTWLVAAAVMGKHVIVTKADFRERSFVPKMSWTFAGLVSALAGAYGVSLLFYGNFNGLIPLVLAWVGLSDARKNLKILSSEIDSPSQWIEKHIECMIGSGIALHTAFFVFGFKGLFGYQLAGVFGIIPWLLPAAIGIATVHIMTKKYRNTQPQTRPSGLLPAAGGESQPKSGDDH